MARKHPPTRKPHSWLDEDKIRQALGLPPLRPKRKPPKIIKMTRYRISPPVTD